MIRALQLALGFLFAMSAPVSWIPREIQVKGEGVLRFEPDSNFYRIRRIFWMTTFATAAFWLAVGWMVWA